MSSQIRKMKRAQWRAVNPGWAKARRARKQKQSELVKQVMSQLAKAMHVK